MIRQLKTVIRSGPVQVVETIDAHLPAFWDILKDWKAFHPGRPVRDAGDFRVWFHETAQDALTGLDSGRVVGGAYLDQIFPGHYATIHVFKRRGYLNPAMVTRIARDALPYFFRKHEIRMLMGIARQRAAIRLAKRLGFKKRGTLPAWIRENGAYHDCTMMILMRGDVKC